jgi:hypothetical protein
MGCIETMERQPANDPEHRQQNDFIVLNEHQDVPHSGSVNALSALSAPQHLSHTGPGT